MEETVCARGEGAGARRSNEHTSKIKENYEKIKGNLLITCKKFIEVVT